MKHGEAARLAWWHDPEGVVSVLIGQIAPGKFLFRIYPYQQLGEDLWASDRLPEPLPSLHHGERILKQFWNAVLPDEVKQEVT